MASTVSLSGGTPSCIRRPSLAANPNPHSTKLHIAVFDNKPSKIKKYLKRGYHVNLYNQDGQSPLFCAVLLRRVKIVKILLKFGSDPNVRCRDGSTSLHAAAFVGCTKCLKLLLVNGGDLRLTDGLLRTPLDWTNLQQDDCKKNAIKQVLDGARLCAVKCNGVELLSEWETIFGPQKRASWRRALPSNSKIYLHSQLVLKHSLIPVGYGKMYYGIGQDWRCGSVVGIPILNGVTDLMLETGSGSWICGKFTTFVSMIWKKREMPVTVRELRKGSLENAMTDILIAEMNYLTALRHPSILMLLAVCCMDNYDSIALVFEKVNLGSLYFYLHNQLGTFSAPSVLDIIAQICDALEFIHSTGFLHGFVNSHSIFLMERNRAKLGCCEYIIPIAASEEDVHQSQHPLLRSDSHLAVHRHWVAPEIITLRQPASVCSDIYSVCCVLWELVYGEVPWKNYSLEALREMMTKNPCARLPLNKNLVPRMWYHMLKMGLEPDATLRVLDISEIRDLMKLCGEKLVFVKKRRLSKTKSQVMPRYIFE